MQYRLFDTPEHDSDVVMTPEWIARDVVQHFQPEGRVLDPCKGDGAFLKEMPGAEWCEIREGRDFYKWEKPMDWIVSNPPYNILREWMRHSMTLAENIVYLIPVTKVFNSFSGMQELYEWGGPVEVLVYGTGRVIGFPLGFAVGAVHFRRGYRDGMRVQFRSQNASIQP
jgi:hypothetical protein